VSKIKNIDDLYNALIAGAVPLHSELPTWGEPPPLSVCAGVHSWDAERVIVGTCLADLVIATRGDVYHVTDPDGRGSHVLAAGPEMAAELATDLAWCEAQTLLHSATDGAEGRDLRAFDSRVASNDSAYPITVTQDLGLPVFP
jgi:hypothetical protein